MDGVPAELYRLTQKESTPKSCLPVALNSVVTKLWNSAEVPIPKKGDLSGPDNYRSISLIQVVLKIISKIATARLNFILERDEVLMKEQAGFRNREECVTQANAQYEVDKCG